MNIDFDINLVKQEVINEVCKKILEEVRKHLYYTHYDDEVIKVDDLCELIKDLGVEV